MKTKKIDPVTLGILWGRLVAIVDEIGESLKRTAFSTIVSESNDFACCLLNERGELLAQSSTSVPSFNATMPSTVKHILKSFSNEIYEGDVFITNDPWLASGHLSDVTIATPIFKKNKLIGFSASVAHKTDMGGRFYTIDVKENYEEGIRIPLSKLFSKGKKNEILFNIVKSNVRSSYEVIGDILAQISTNDVGKIKLLRLMEEQKIEDLDVLSKEIISRSEKAMEDAIKKIPDGTYEYTTYSDGFDTPTKFKVTISIKDDHITVDYTGTSSQVEAGINVPYCYTFAYTSYAIKCVILPEVPNNEGSFKPITVNAPEGSILNSLFPAPVGARQVTGHFIPFVVMGALSKVLPGRVITEGGMEGSSFLRIFKKDGKQVTQFFTGNGGMGARATKDGISCLAFPSNISNAPIEMMEKYTGLIWMCKEIRSDSGGPGKFRGGCGQTVGFRVPENIKSVTVSLRSDRTKHPALGLQRGKEGARRINLLNKTTELHPKKHAILKPGDEFIIEWAGGGGFGNPLKRDSSLVERDVQNGYVSIEKAKTEYGVVVDFDNKVDIKETKLTRSKK